MLGSGLGLSEVSTSDLIKCLRMLVRKDLPAPIDVIGLARVGLQHCAEPILDAVRGLDERATRIVLICVIAERQST